MDEELEAVGKALGAVSHLVSILAKGDDEAAYHAAKAAQRTLERIAARPAPDGGGQREAPTARLMK